VRLAAAAAATVLRAARPDSVFGGVQVGAITYSFRALPSSAEQVLKYLLDCGISAIELMANVAESYAGAPERPTKDWRLSVSMDKYKAFRALYNDAGVSIYAFKLPPTMGMSDAEYDYIWNVAETLGANHVTMELPNNDELLHRVAEYAAKRTLRIAFHTHGQGGESGFEKALGASPYTALNLDVGHYWGVNGVSPVPVIVKYHDRIASLHLKDRKGPASGAAGPNMPWGQGETPLQEILLTLKKNAYKFPASIEYEYNTPEGSDVVTEVKKCVQYCKDVLVG
jgi:sugar phosphate isomerase/epimerase